MGIKAVATLQGLSGLSTDRYVNTFAIGGLDLDEMTEGEQDNIAQAIIEFYSTSVDPIGVALGALMSGCIDRAALRANVKLYDISASLFGTPHGSPKHEVAFTVPAEVSGTATPLPEEVAVVCTLEAHNRGLQSVETPDNSDPGTAVQRPRSRYTGRIFFGPLSMYSQVLLADANGNARVDTDLRDALIEGITNITVLVNAEGGFLGVWSRTDGAIRAVDQVSVDDAFDTQRRRGARPVSRTRVDIASTSLVELAA